jgi:arylsulfatase A-like enzyme
MKKNVFILGSTLFILLAIFFNLSHFSKDIKPGRPNVILILADDLGIMDLCSYASRINKETPNNCFYETPNIDALASIGISFNRAYATPLCSPTRASIISGQYGAKLGFNNAFSMKAFRSYSAAKLNPPQGFLAHDRINREKSDPKKALIGAVSSSALIAGGVDDQGQDILSIAEYMTAHDSAFIGKWHIGGGGLNDYRPASQGFEEIAFHDEGWSDYFGWRNDWHNPGKTQGRDYLTDEITSQAVEWISGRQSIEKPFLLVVSHFAVHGPFEAKDSNLEYYDNKANKGLGGHGSAVYASMLQSLDDSVGDIIRALSDTGLDRSTLVIFMSDNGGVITKKGRSVTSNLPFRGGKGAMYEGGIRVPLIFTWPKRFDKGTLVDTAVDATDIYPTILAATGYSTEKYDKFGDGQSLTPLIDSQPNNGAYRKPHFFYDPFYRVVGSENSILETTPKTVVIEGKFKLIQYHLGYSELYDLVADPFENTDISSSEPVEVSRLRNLAAQWEKTIPYRYRTRENPSYNEKKSPYPVYRDAYYKQVHRG